MSAAGLRAAYLRGELTPPEVLTDLRARILATEPIVHAWTAFAGPSADVAAAEAQAALTRDGAATPPLTGIPIAVKDMIDTAGLTTAYGSLRYRNHVPATDATAVALLRRAGAIVLGKTNTHEFAWGITTRNPHYGSTRNPWGPGRVAGGSSGGSAAALAAHAVPLAIGTDTAGSVRIPSALCGLCGIKATHGRINSTGIFPLAPSLDTVGALARTPRDADLLMAGLAGTMPSLDGSPPDLHGVRVGVVEDPGDEATAAALALAMTALVDRGAVPVPIAVPDGEAAREVLARVQAAEAISVHRSAGLYPAFRDDYGADVLARLDRAAALPAEEAAAGRAQRDEVRAGYREVFRRVDLLLTPAVVGPPAPIIPGDDTAEDLFRALAMRWMVGPSLAGLPAGVVRATMHEGLPVAAQLVAAPRREDLVLQAMEAVALGTAATQALWPEL